jgi:hypothetical protein
MDTHVWRPKPATTGVLTIAGTTSSAEVLLGVNDVVLLSSAAAYQIKFGMTGMTAATANDFYIPAGVIPDAWEFTPGCLAFRVYNPSGSQITVTYMKLGKR